MEYRRLGKAGSQASVFALGIRQTFAESIGDEDPYTCWRRFRLKSQGEVPGEEGCSCTTAIAAVWF
jgi:hypothetical protein